MSYGYNLRVVRKNKKAPSDMLGVRLGRACIAHDIPVQSVAEHFGISRQAVYNWFSGVSDPGEALVGPVMSFLSNLTHPE